MASELLISREDLNFLLYEWLHIEELAVRDHYREHDRETFDGLIDLAAEVASDVFRPINKILDDQEPTMAPDGSVVQPKELGDALRVFTQSGLSAATFPVGLGGDQVPTVVRVACSAYLHAGSIGASAYSFLSEGNARLIVAYGSQKQIDTFARPLIEGRWFGTMALSETEAGSSLGDITTLASPQPDGTFRLRGSKMWISGGDHELSENIVHLVLAKTIGAPAGSKGISLFIVPRILPDDEGALGERNDVALAGLNHKMGYRGTTNTLLAFGNGAWTPGGKPGAVGYLVGDVGRGLEYMFHMMNEARIGVGAGAAALGYTGYLHALDYARNRSQGRPSGVKDPTTPPVPIIEHADVRRMLLAQKAYAEGSLALILYCARLVDDEQTAATAEEGAAAGALLSLLTPIAKSWPSQWALRANELAIQVHGGYGYARDFPVEQFYRDNRLNMIHEGTNGIQAIDLLARKVLRDDGAALKLLDDRLRRACANAHAVGGEVAEHAKQLGDDFDRLLSLTVDLAASPDVAMANASNYLDALGHLVVGWLWLEQETAVAGRVDAFAQGKAAAASYFFRYELPRVATDVDVLARGERLTLDLNPNAL